MENELQFSTLDEDLITFEVEFETSATEKEFQCNSIEEKLKLTTKEDALKLTCQICDKTFRNTWKRNLHMRKIHNVEVSGRSKLIICPLSECLEKFFTLAALREHIVQIHNIYLEVEMKTFRSYEEFSLWKEKMERETRSRYIKKRSSNVQKRKLKDVFVCHRSGVFTSHRRGEIKRLSRIGSKRIGAYCPASIIVTHSAVNTYVKVEHWTKHLGHECEMHFLRLTKKEKMEIADKIKKGMTFTEILEFYKNPSGSEVCRINALSRRDLSNIVEQFNIKRNRVPKRYDEIVSLWVKNMEEYGNDSPVAFFKTEGTANELLNLEDFMIVIMTKYQREMGIKYSGKNICIDSIHGMGSQGLSLTALLAIDELSAVFPLAFCISSRTDEVSLMVFFNSVKRLVGTIEAPVFMSNDDPVFYNAWEKIMAPSSFQLLCNWHVDSCWRRDLEKIGDRDKQASVHETLKKLLEESDVSEFESSINNFVIELEEDASTREFAEYFCNNYLPRLKMWAFCYMRHLGISTVEHLETMHASLQDLFLNGGEGDNIYDSQIDLAIPALLKLSRDKLLGRLDELLECLPVDTTNRIHKGHRMGKRAWSVTALSENSWSVKYYRIYLNGLKDGKVFREKGACSLEVCYLRCSTCSICIHSFFCTCFDSLINVNICGHIHACAMFCSDPKSINKVARENDTIDGFISDGEKIGDTAIGEEVSETFIDHKVPSSSSAIKLQNQPTRPSSSKTVLSKQLNTIKTMMEFTVFSKEHASQLENSFDAIISFMVMHGKSTIPYIHVPYKPTKNYLSTVKSKYVISTANKPAVIRVVNQKPVYPINQKPVIHAVNQEPLIHAVNQEPVIYAVNQEPVYPINQKPVCPVNQEPVIHAINQKPAICSENQKPANNIVNQQSSLLPVNQQSLLLPVNQRSLLRNVSQEPVIQHQKEIITIGQPVCLYPVKNINQT